MSASHWGIVYVIGVAWSWCRFQQVDRVAPLTGARYLWYPVMTLGWPLTIAVGMILKVVGVRPNLNS